MHKAKVTSKGQITIPAEVREAMRLQPGDRVDFIRDEDGRFLLFAKNASIRDLKGCVPSLDHVPTIEEINEGIGAAAAESYLQSVRKSARDKSKNEAA